MGTQIGNADRTIVIPSVELKGTRAEKLAQLDSFISRLRAIRRDLQGDERQDALGHRSRRDWSARGWWVAGATLAAAFVLVMLWAWMTGTAFGAPPLESTAVAGSVFR